MSSLCHSGAAKILLSFATAFIALGLGATAYGQGSRQQTTLRDLSGSEQTLTALEAESRRAKRDPQTIMAEVNEDFARLREINDDLKNVATSSATPNYKTLSDEASEIKKRGARLRSNLAALPKGDKEDKPKEAAPSDDTQMRGLLTSMNTALTGFLGNPIFSDMGSLDNQLALKARRDLEYVINLSDIIKSGADKLGKRKN